MLLSDVFDYLTHGELSQLYTGGGEVMDIDPLHYPKLITNINMGMIELYKRFPLRTQEIILQLYDQISMYKLHSRYAQSNTDSVEPIKYILDATTVEEFKDTILLITQVYNEDGTERPMNDLEKTDPDIETGPISVFTPTPTTLQVLDPSDENTLSIIFRASPDKIIYQDVTEPEDVWVDLPDQFIEALCAYVGYRHFSSLGMENNNDASQWLAKFELAIGVINQLGLFPVDNNWNEKFDENGWI